MVKRSIASSIILVVLSFLFFPTVSYATIQGDQAPLSEAEIAVALAAGEIGPSPDEPMVAASTSSSFVDVYAGPTRFDTAAAQALAAFSSSEYVILAGDGGWADALAGTGLAGLLDCPVLLTSRGSLPQPTADAIRRLGSTKAVVLGGDLMIQSSVDAQLRSMGLSVTRLAGPTRQDTQLEIYRFGATAPKGRGWSADYIAFTSGYGFHDALSFAPAAYAAGAPVFLLDSAGDVSPAQRAALGSAKFASPVVLGGTLVSSREAERFAASVSKTGRAERVYGSTRFDTSARVAEWAVSRGLLEWDNAAFAAASLPYDALAGSVLQGRSRSVLLMVDGGTGSGPAVSSAVSRRGDISRIRFFGGNLSISQGARTSIVAALSNSSIKAYRIAINQLENAQINSINSMSSWSEEQKKSQISLLPVAINPLQSTYGSPDFYQFACLDSGYTGISADNLNSYIATYGADGKLSGQGAAFVEASKLTGLSESYLLAHAILESGWGKSALARGFEYNGTDMVDGKTYPKGIYYNFYGIGAVDSGPLSGGRALAVKMGWDSPQKAIIGAARWIKENYISRSQYTLYLMRWNPSAIENGGTASHQYATDVEWARKIARVMGEFNVACGRTQATCGMRFEMPSYL